VAETGAFSYLGSWYIADLLALKRRILVNGNRGRYHEKDLMLFYGNTIAASAYLINSEKY
jgi:hypothetical protein